MSRVVGHKKNRKTVFEVAQGIGQFRWSLYNKKPVSTNIGKGLLIEWTDRPLGNLTKIAFSLDAVKIIPFRRGGMLDVWPRKLRRRAAMPILRFTDVKRRISKASKDSWRKAFH